jgi:four helix bundle protein
MTDGVQTGTLRRAVDLQGRTKAFALRVLKMFRALPKEEAARILGRQMFRSATSVAANCRATCRTRSRREFVARIGVVVEEADETAFWLEFIRDAEILEGKVLMPLVKEVYELVAIFSASQATARRNMK